MLTDTDIASMRAAIRHALNHLDEVREDINDQYLGGDSAPETVITQLIAGLNTVEEYATELRAALTMMVTGGLRDDGRGGWYVSNEGGPYATLDEALAVRDDDGVSLVIQNVDDEQASVAADEVYVDGVHHAELQLRASAVVNEWHDDDLSADAVSHMAELVPDELVPWRAELEDGDLWRRCSTANGPARTTATTGGAASAFTPLTAPKPASPSASSCPPSATR
jgi:hypothetical protein